MRAAMAAAAACAAMCVVLGSGVTAGTAPAAAAPRKVAAPATTKDPKAVRALARLRSDADTPLRLHGDGSGRLTFVGTRAGDTIDNPAVSAHDGAVTVARRDLDRYGDALGLPQGAAGMRTLSHHQAPSGDTVVRLQQTVDGLPVIGGQVVVTVAANGGTSSILSSTSTGTRTSTARVSRAEAAATAVAVTAHARHVRASTLRVGGGSLAVFDPAAFGARDTGARTVRDYEVTNGTDIREQVIIDAVTGQVVLHVDNVQTLNRNVCDRKNTPGNETLCATGAARSEGGAAGSVADVNKAYTLTGEVSDFYQQIGGLDLTQLIGFGPSGSRTLGSTVRFCEPTNIDAQCPYKNAFWNGQQMFYGAGFAGADDVVGHEMTHGVISKYSDLFYYFQSGAINESLADIMGEIVDHRNGPDAGDNASWTMGEDLQGGAIRSLASPTAYGQPDKMTSSRYVADTSLGDSGGVHENSGVGNKTAYLIMHGGTFNGVTVTGIDAGDPMLTKSAQLYLDVIEKLTSGSDYADLGRQLQQSCTDLLTAGTAGFTSADCTNVGLAVQATELDKQPTVANASTPADATAACPAGQTKHVLFDNEASADPTADFSITNTMWVRAPGTVRGYAAGSNATSGSRSWFGLDPDPTFGDPRSGSLVLKNAVHVPVGGRTYMRFNQWHAFDYDPSAHVYYDGGLVKVDDTGDSAGPQQTSGLPWVNGPTRAVRSSGSPAQKGFGGVSHGYYASRVDLTSYAGKTIKPQFQVIGDGAIAIEGWYLDDITIYTCGEELPGKPRAVKVTGGLGSAYVSWQQPTWAGDGILGYRVLGPGMGRADLPAAARASPWFTGLAPGKNATFTVRALNEESALGPAGSVTVYGTRFSGLSVSRAGTTQTRVTGTLLKGATRLAGRVVDVQRRVGTGPWTTVASPKTDSKGHLAVTLRGRGTALYHLVFAGGPGLLGRTSGGNRL